MEAWGIAPGSGKENLISAESAIHFWRRFVPSLPECPNRSARSSFISSLAKDREPRWIETRFQRLVILGVIGFLGRRPRFATANPSSGGLK